MNQYVYCSLLWSVQYLSEHIFIAKESLDVLNKRGEGEIYYAAAASAGGAVSSAGGAAAAAAFSSASFAAAAATGE